MDAKKTCFVVQGFGEKTDLTTGRVLNLDASYEVIKEAVEEAGLKCMRADEIVHSGEIDRPMYEWLYRADLVIADLSTYNVNAAFELGVRYGLRSRFTIIVAEGSFKNPFDVSHIVIRNYEHLGKDIGRKEAQRFKKDLVDCIKAIVDQDKVDSPVYEYLRLRPPSDEAEKVEGVKAAMLPSAEETGTEQSAKDLLAQARAALARDEFLSAKALFQAVHTLRPRDEYVIQQLALATYKSKSPDAMSALEEAHKILQGLGPDTTNDPETLGLWGAIHKRFWDLKEDKTNLDASIAAYERGFYLKQDYYNGINLAFLLDVRASVLKKNGERTEAIADAVLARRVRRETARLAEQALAAVPPYANEAKYWLVATLWEAAVGIDDSTATARWKAEAEALPVPKWMLETTGSQLTRLTTLLAASPLKEPL